jgi:DNA polymerase-3 subunit delta
MTAKDETHVIAIIGDEPYLKEEHIRSILDSVAPEGEAEITEFNGRETAIADILDELRTFPFFNSHRIVIVRNADALLTNHDESLSKYTENAASSSTLVLDFSTLDGKSKFAKMLKKHGKQIRVERMREYQVPRWLQNRASKKYGKKLRSTDAAFMVEIAGTNPGLLDSELAKIASLTAGSDSITRQHIDSVITRGRAQTVFKLTEQVEAKNKAGALKLLDEIFSQGIYDDRAGSTNSEGTGIVTYLLHMLNWSISRMWTANQLMEKGKPQDEIVSTLKLHQRFKDEFLSRLRKYWPLSECRRCFRELLAADRNVKKSMGNLNLILESLVVALCSQVMAQGKVVR